MNFEKDNLQTFLQITHSFISLSRQGQDYIR